MDNNQNKIWYGFIYRNYFPARWCFFNGKDQDNLYNVDEAKEWYRSVEKYMTSIEFDRPPKKKINILMPIWNITEEPVEEDKQFSVWVSQVKIEPRMGYVIDQILDEYYFGADWLFYPRTRKHDWVLWDADYDVVFNMREVIEWMIRLKPLQVRTTVETDTQKIKFADWDIGVDVHNVPFNYNGQTYETSLLGLYWGRFRQALFPNSDFSWYPLMPWQREVMLWWGYVTIIKAARGNGKSKLLTHLAETYLFKDLNFPNEYDRPFTIVYGGISKSANMQVVDYILTMAKQITTNKHILKFNKEDMVLTLYDGHNERKIKFVSQWQEGQGMRWLRPHLVILDEASRLSKSMYDTAAWFGWAPIICISTPNQDDERNWFEDKYKEGIAKQRLYEPIEDTIKRLWIKYGMHKIKTKDQMLDFIYSNKLKQIREELRLARPIVSYKYDIYAAVYKTATEIELDIAAFDWDEEACLAELFCELGSGSALFNAEWLIESSFPSFYDFIAMWYDHAEDFDNPAVVMTGYIDGKAYVYHSENLPKDDYKKRYDILNDLYNDALNKSHDVIVGWDFSNGWQTLLREFDTLFLTPKYPIKFTSAKHDEVRKDRPFVYMGKKFIEKITKEEFFMKWDILFHEDTDTETGLIWELSSFKSKWEWAAKWKNKRPDDQVNALMISLFIIYYEVIRKIPVARRTWIMWDTEYQNIMRRWTDTRNKEREREENMRNYMKKFW